MITPQEIEAKSQEFDIHIPNVQRDYVFGWLIFGLYTISLLKDTLVLKGGNALRKAYFPNTRFSDDLDFTTENSLDSQLLINEFNKICQFVQEQAGVTFDFDRNEIVDERMINEIKKVYKVRLYFKDFYQGTGHITISIRMDITEFDKLYLSIQSRNLIHPYSDFEKCSTQIRCIKLEEALADKFKCLLQRRYSFDLYDLVYAIFVNNELEVDKGEVIRTFLKKTIFEPSPIAVKNLLLGLPLDLFRSFWETSIVSPIKGRIGFDDAIDKFKVGLEVLFADFSYGEYNALAYFPANLRNPILKAGVDRTVLKLTYDGIERLVEPYSIIYKRRQDGVAQEYFYGYDQTGGRSSPAGIKAFLNTKLTTLENTTQTFDPRYEIELSKAGETTNNSYFGRPFAKKSSNILSSKPKKYKAPRSSYHGLTYTIQCSYCGKRFKRDSYTTRLNDHKDKYGNKCFGRFGYIT